MVNLRTAEGTPLEVVLQQERPSSALVREIVLAGADLGCRGVCFIVSMRVSWGLVLHLYLGFEIIQLQQPVTVGCGVFFPNQGRSPTITAVET